MELQNGDIKNNGAKDRWDQEKEKEAGWRKGRASQGTLQQSVNLLASISPPDLGTWDPGWDFSVTRSYGTIFAQSCNLWGLGLPGHKGYGFRQASHTASSQRCGSGFGTLLEAVGEGSLPGFCGSSAWLLQGWPRFRRWRGAGRAAALGQSNGDVAATLAGSAQSQCQAACRPGGYGRAIAKAFTRRGRQCVQDIQALRRFGSRLHQPQGNFAVNSRFASAFHRPAHGVRGKVDQRCWGPSRQEVIAQSASRWLRCGSCRGFEGRWRSSGRTSTMRPISGAVKAKLATVPPGPTPSWWRQQRVGSNRRLPCYSIWPSSTSMSGTITSGKKAGKTRFPTRLLACWCASYEGWRFLEADKCATFLSGPLGPFCQVAVGPGNSPGNNSHTPPDLQALERGRRHFGARGGHSQDGASPYCRSGQASGGSPPGTRSAALQGQVQSPHRWSGQAQACPTAAAGGARDRGERFGTQRWAGGGGHSSSRAVLARIEAYEAGQAAPQGRGTHWQAHPHWLLCRGALGFRGFGLHSNTAPIHQSRRSQSHIPAQPRAKRWQEFGKAPQTSTPCRPRCAAHWPGSVASSGRGAEQRTQRPPSCSRSIAWVGARSQRGTSRPTTAPRSTSWQLCPKRWASGWTRHPFCGLTALHTGISPRARCSGKPSGHSSFLANWKAGHFGIGTCSSSWSHGTQERLARLRSEDDGSCQLCNDGPGTMFHRCYECPALQTERDVYVSQEVRVAARALGSQHRELFAHGIFPDPGAILPTGFPERECQVYWHNRPPDGLLEGHIFTDGFSSGSGALRRAGWAVVAVDDAGNLNAAACGAVPSDVLPGQSARLRCGHGGSVHFGSAYALHRLRRYHCNN